MAASCFANPLSSSSSSSSRSSYNAIPKYKSLVSSTSSYSYLEFPFSISFQLSPLSRPFLPKPLQIKVSSSNLSVLDEEKEEEEIKGEGDGKTGEKETDVSEAEPVVMKKPRPCEIYVCNIPRNYEISQLLEMFQPFGTVISVEIISLLLPLLCLLRSSLPQLGYRKIHEKHVLLAKFKDDLSPEKIEELIKVFKLQALKVRKSLQRLRKANTKELLRNASSSNGATSDINSPVSGTVVEVTEELIESPGLVSRNPQTGESRGSGYVTMGSINSAKIAIASLDGTEVGGREMRVRYSADMNPGTKRNQEALNSTPKKILMYESQYKVYVGNLPWKTQPDGLRDHFSKFGTIVSTRVLHDRKTGRNRVFAFLSFANPEERDAALSLNGTEYEGRRIIVREGIEKTES